MTSCAAIQSRRAPNRRSATDAFALFTEQLQGAVATGGFAFRPGRRARAPDVAACQASSPHPAPESAPNEVAAALRPVAPVASQIPRREAAGAATLQARAVLARLLGRPRPGIEQEHRAVHPAEQRVQIHGSKSIRVVIRGVSAHALRSWRFGRFSQVRFSCS